MKLKVTFFGIDATLFAITLALSLHEASLANAQTPSAAQIVFLHCKIKDETITLIKANTRPGVVKQKRGGETRGGIYYDVVSASGKLLWNGRIENPLMQRVEYGDPANSGRIKIKYITHEEAGFTLRMPFRPDAHRIEFYRLESSADQNRRKILRRPIGSILLQMKRDEPK